MRDKPEPQGIANLWWPQNESASELQLESGDARSNSPPPKTAQFQPRLCPKLGE